VSVENVILIFLVVTLRGVTNIVNDKATGGVRKIRSPEPPGFRRGRGRNHHQPDRINSNLINMDE